MRDQKRRERALMEEAYQHVNENFGPAAQTASIGAEGPIMVGDEESCGSVEPDIDALAAQAIAAITELAAAAGANINVTVESEQEEVHEVDIQEIEIPVDQFNIGYEETGNT